MKLEAEKPQPLVDPGIVGSTSSADPHNSNEIAALLNFGIKSAQAGNRAEARTALFKVTDADSRNEAAWLWLASLSEYPEELLVFLNNVLDVNPDNERAREWKTATNSLLAKTFVQRGVDSAEDGRKDFAADCFQKALEFDQSNITAWLWLASLSETNDGKLNYLEMALEIEPDNEAAKRAYDNAKRSVTASHLAEAKLAAVSGRKSDAMELLSAVIAEDPCCEDAWLLRAHFVDTVEEKIDAFDRVLTINSENPAAKYGAESLRTLVGIEKETETYAPPVHVPPPVTSIFLTPENGGSSYDPATFRDPTQELVIPEAIANDVHDMGSRAAQVVDRELREKEESAADSEVTQESVWPDELDIADTDIDEPEVVEFEMQGVDDLFSPEQPPPTSEFEVWNAETTENTDGPDDETLGASLPFEDVPGDTDLAPAAFHDDEIGEHTAEVYEEINVEAPSYSLADSIDPDTETENEEAISVEPVGSYSLSFVTDRVAEVSDTANAPKVPAVENDVAPEQIWIDSAERAAEVLDAPNDDPYLTIADISIPMPEQQIPEPQAAVNPFETTVDDVYVRSAETSIESSSVCPFCSTPNQNSAVSCGSCYAFLTLADLDAILSNDHADKAAIRNAVEKFEAGRNASEMTEAELTMLGIGHLNLRNLQHGYNYLYEAARMNPNNIILASQVNELLMRLEDIKKHDQTAGSVTSGKTILVVDDSPTVRKLIAGKLEKCGHTVYCSPDGIDAVEALTTLPMPDLILLDINMPRMDGYQTCKSIRAAEATKNIPIVMISGKDGFFDKVRGRMAGTSGYITKPFGPETLMKTVETYLAGGTENSPIAENV